MLKRVGIFAILSLFLIFALILVGQIDMRSRMFHLLGFGWLIFVLIMLILTHEVSCPRCGQRFYARGADFFQITTECLHCGQPKGAVVGMTSKPSSDNQ